MLRPVRKKSKKTWRDIRETEKRYYKANIKLGWAIKEFSKYDRKSKIWIKRGR